LIRERCLLNIRRILFTPQNFDSGIGIIDGKDMQIRLCNVGSVSEYFSLDLGVKTLIRGVRVSWYFLGRGQTILT
jgi:hypothetical protein